MKIVISGHAREVLDLAEAAKKRGLTVSEARHQEWTRETAAAALREWTSMSGEMPTFNAWSPAPEGCPSRRTLQTLFGSWRAALEAAGLPAPGPGQYRRVRGRPAESSPESP